MWDWLSFFVGFSIDAVTLTVLMVLLGPRLIERWAETHLADLVVDFLKSDAFKDIRALLIQQFKGAVFGGRPPSIKGAIKSAGALAVQEGAKSLLGKVFGGIQQGAEQAPTE